MTYRKFLSGLILFGLSIFIPDAWAATSKSETVKVIYKHIVNGQERPQREISTLVATPNRAKSYTDNTGIRLIPVTPTESAYVDYEARKTWQTARLANGSEIYYESDFSEYPGLVITDDTAVFLGYSCKKATSSLRSNSIEIWYTHDLQVKGTPLMNYGIPDGLVLKVVRNGNYAVEASSVEK